VEGRDGFQRSVLQARIGAAISHFASRRAAKTLIDSLVSNNPSRDNGWSGNLAGKNSTQGGDR